MQRQFLTACNEREDNRRRESILAQVGFAMQGVNSKFTFKALRFLRIAPKGTFSLIRIDPKAFVGSVPWFHCLFQSQLSVYE
jgi:hypothetical protein